MHSTMNGFDFWQFIAGITVFVYGMYLIEQSVKALAGRSFKKFLQKHSRSQFKMTLSSTVVTAVLQSSSVVLLMVLSFVGAGLMNLQGALSAALGANLGSTFVNWIIALVGFKVRFDAMAYPILGIALIGLIFFRKSPRWTQFTSFLIGFAFIFISLQWLKTSVDTSFDGQLDHLKGLPYLLYIPIGFFITGLIQSSSATVAITLTAVHNHLIPFESAAAMVIGSEVGTTLKFLLGSIGGIPDKKRVAWGNFLLNFFTMVMAALLLQPLVHFIQHLCQVRDPLIGIVLFQTIINFLAMMIFFPFLGPFARFLERFFSGPELHGLTKHIRKETTALPGDAIELAEKEVVHLMYDAMELNKRVFGMHEEERRNWISQIRHLTQPSDTFAEEYERLKLLHGEILEYITEIPKEGMTENEIEKTGKLITIIRHVLRSAKNMKDIHHNLEEFESSANDELFSLYQHMRERARKFYGEFHLYVDDPKHVSSAKIVSLTRDNRRQYDENIAVLITALRENKIGELDSSNLLNVNREIYSSNKALIRSLADLSDLEAEDA